MEENKDIDIIDLHILELLRNNSRMPFVKIADELGISEGTVRIRIKKLNEKGVIKQYTIIKGNSNLLKTIIFLKINLQFIEKNLEILKNIEKIDSICELTGEFNLMLIGNFKGIDDFKNFIWNYINSLEGIEKMKTTVIIKKYKDELNPRLI
ncbi:MAG: Lrp/AsnC family transcriptional regulator [Candidatus Helarchaeota archaeon]